MKAAGLNLQQQIASDDINNVIVIFDFKAVAGHWDPSLQLTMKVTLHISTEVILILTRKAISADTILFQDYAALRRAQVTRFTSWEMDDKLIGLSIVNDE